MGKDGLEAIQKRFFTFWFFLLLINQYGNRKNVWHLWRLEKFSVGTGLVVSLIDDDIINNVLSPD
jgi:hypothetical protein